VLDCVVTLTPIANLVITHARDLYATLSRLRLMLNIPYGVPGSDTLQSSTK
jgi:hypothetical protein